MEKKLDLRIEKTYLLLHNAFTELIEEKRFEDITVNELCNRAMIRRTTFYKHFADKYEYFTYYMTELRTTFQKEIGSNVVSEDVGVYFMNMVHEMIRFLFRNEKMLRHVMESNQFPILLNILSEQIRADMLDRIRESTKNKRTKDMPRPEVLASFFSGGLLNTLYWWLMQGEPLNEDAFCSDIEKMFAKKLLRI